MYRKITPECFLYIYIQECIPVGCAPPAAVAVCLGGGGCICLMLAHSPGPKPGHPRGQGHPHRYEPGPPGVPGKPPGVGLDTPLVILGK